MLPLHRQEMRREPLLDGNGQHRHPILLSFATPDHDLVAIDALTCLSTASHVRNATISAAPIADGCFL